MAPHTQDLTKLSLCDAAQKIRLGEVSSSELVDACLERVANTDGEIGAFAHLDPDHARQQAKHADEARATGNGTGPLHGVPIAIKDIIDTADYPTENGCPIFSGNTPKHDAPCVAALRNAGAVIIGKTVTTELALLTPAKTKNPANLAHTPGGSSAGSAAAVSADMVPGALGTQTAGSILRPASYCGIVGFKPTLGLISRRGVLMQSHTLDTVGVLTRTVPDAALLTQCMAAYDAQDPVSYQRSQSSLHATASDAPPSKPLFGFVKTPAWAEGTADLHDAFGELTSTLGDLCEEITPDSLEAIIEWQRIVQIAENAAYYGPLLDQAPEHISEGLTARIQAGRKEAVVDYITAIAARDTAIEQISSLFNRYTAILTPAAPGTAPKGLSITGSPIFNGLWTYLGMPTVSLPLMEANGLPVGAQLVGPQRDDGRLLRTANWLMSHLMQDAE